MKKTKGYEAVNYMEKLVNTTLRSLLADLPKSHRPSARKEADIKALALNRLWPMYVTTERGKRFVERDVVTDRVDRDIARELRLAINRVERHPQHRR